MATREPSELYLTLPSNSESKNKTGQFSVRLPRQISLEGRWEVALVDVLYPLTWVNLSAKAPESDSYIAAENQYQVLFMNNNTYECTVPAKYYDTIEELLDNFTLAFFDSIRQNEEEARAMPADHLEETLNRALSLWYDPVYGRVRITLDTEKVRGIIMSKKLQYILGLKTSFVQGKNILGQYAPNLKVDQETLWIYTDIVEKQIIGNAYAELLRIVHVKGKYGDYVEKHFMTPHYVPLKAKHLDKIDIEIRENSGNIVQFEYGTVICKLHLRRKRFAL